MSITDSVIPHSLGLEITGHTEAVYGTATHDAVATSLSVKLLIHIVALLTIVTAHNDLFPLLSVYIALCSYVHHTFCCVYSLCTLHSLSSSLCTHMYSTDTFIVYSLYHMYSV